MARKKLDEERIPQILEKHTALSSLINEELLFPNEHERIELI